MAVGIALQSNWNFFDPLVSQTVHAEVKLYELHCLPFSFYGAFAKELRDWTQHFGKVWATRAGDSASWNARVKSEKGYPTVIEAWSVKEIC